MNGTVAVTDFGWYQFLAARAPDEVNFWTPSDRRPFNAPAFSPFFFKLKAPHRAIGGFGYFVKWSSLPDWLAWDCFGVGNGTETLASLRSRLAEIRDRIGYKAETSTANIGCILLVQVTFFPRDQWVAQPNDWHDRTVSSKGYDLTVGEGRRIWNECLERAAHLRPTSLAQLPLVAGPTGPRYGAPRLVEPRLGQGTFRVSVTDAYGRSCAVTGEHSLPALEAAHIRAYTASGPHEIRNGILLRADLHKLFDTGYITVTPERRLQVSPRLRADFSNGRSYYPLHGVELSLPANQVDQPADEFLAWHNDTVYLR